MDFSVLLKEHLDDDDKILISKIEDWVYLSEKQYVNKFSFFLDERQCDLAKRYLNSIGVENFTFFGGYENAKRKVLCIYPLYSEINESLFPISAFTAFFKSSYTLSHRDFLGALMSLKINRNCVGDICVSDGKAVFFVIDTADTVVSEIKKVGNIGVTIRSGFDILDIKPDKFEDINGTVMSLRLDAVVSLVTGLSREKSSALIKSENVTVNFISTDNISLILKIGDSFSIKGYGKFILDSENGISKKGRTHLTIKKYV